MGMIDFALQELQRYDDWRRVLDAYGEAHRAARDQSADFDGWLPRLVSVEEVPDENLAPIHGRLIAAGYLKFQLGDRQTGLMYQLTQSGKAALGHREPTDNANSEERSTEDRRAASTNA